MDNFIENYKGYSIYKPKQDTYMKAHNLYYMAYDMNENLFDGAETLEELHRRIDENQSN